MNITQVYASCFSQESRGHTILWLAQRKMVSFCM
jgi:hypothetical protein